MNNFIYGLILSILPISELRGGIPVAMSSGVNIWVIFFTCVLVNIYHPNINSRRHCYRNSTS
ncbi:small multi-drug export protein [Candidatus Woesearchaeota archaeon]|nr:small multi-drug export protein [Candidatus Woesearchaeota archaeon]